MSPRSQCTNDVLDRRHKKRVIIVCKFGGSLCICYSPMARSQRVSTSVTAVTEKKKKEKKKKKKEKKKDVLNHKDRILNQEHAISL